jgi:CheY-like chemotaxis protein
MHLNYNWHDKTILIVDDEYMNYILFEAILEDTNAYLIHVTNGEQAIEKCMKNQKIDLVLMDINMPVVDGYEAVKRIKQVRKDLPVIAQTAYTASEDYYKCISAGFDEYIVKPIDRDSLFSKINSFFTRSKVLHDE